MRFNLTIFLLALSFHFCFAQNPEDKTVYLDSLKYETTEGNHAYYRIIENYGLKKSNYVVTDFYKSGTIQMKGNYANKEASIKNGDFVTYYENGNRKSFETYVKSRRLGIYHTWYENGNKKLESEFLENPEKDKGEGALKIYRFWDKSNKQTVADGNGSYEETENGYKGSGNLKNGFKDGPWTGNDSLLKYTFKENYTAGKLTSGVSIDTDKIEHAYTEVAIKPDFKGGMEAFYKFIAKNFRTPEEEGLYGKIILSFEINIDGKISGAKVIRDIGYGTGDEALRVIALSPDWKPGIMRGILAKVHYTLPITIQSTN